MIDTRSKAVKAIAKTGIAGAWYRARRFLHRTFTRGPSMFRRLGVAMSQVPVEKRGLVIIQVDGLSYRRMQKALKKRRLPFLRKLIRRGRLKVHPYLSQMPTSTPAFQAGMFYGNNENIPGFNFYDKGEQRLYRMGDSDCAYSVERDFKNPGLLRQGSVFSCVYNGGAEASLFIFSSLLAPRRWKFALRAYDLAMLTFLHVEIVAKTVVLAINEFIVACWDFVRRVATGKRRSVRKELETIAIRVGLSVMSREIITLGAVMDVFRRVPIVYVNFLSYDEHSHIRGPNSAFAGWSLRAIDRCIHRIYNATRFAERKYDFYVLSDHGQSACRPFQMVAGETLASFLQKQLAGMSVDNHPRVEERAGQMQLSADAAARIAQSAPWYLRKPLNVYSDRMREKLPELNPDAGVPQLHDVTVVSTGPIAYAYWTSQKGKLTAGDIEGLHPGLLDVVSHHPCISFVSAKLDESSVLVRSHSGYVVIGPAGVRTSEGTMPFDASVNRQHVLEGIRRITLMRRSGDLCFWGGNSRKGDISFSDEYGCHSGWTDEEIQAFVMAPPDAGFDFASVRRHAEFYEFFNGRYGMDNAAAVGVAGDDACERKVELA